MDNFFLNGKNVLVTGCCGTIGQEMILQLLSGKYGKIRNLLGIDNNESELFAQTIRYSKYENLEFLLCDIRQKEALIERFVGIDLVFHCAALKHVGMCERVPDQAVLTNVLGVQNIIEAAKATDVEKVIFTSSDKAVNPTNVMGSTKLVGERLFGAAFSNLATKEKIFATTRFGNVLGSNGSVYGIFKNQIKTDKPITLTDPSMTRFVMSRQQAVALVIETARIAVGGEVFVTKMPVINIENLGIAMFRDYCEVYGISNRKLEFQIIGQKSGEKMYEELMNSEEVRRTVNLENYFCINPIQKNYSSATISQEEGIDKPYVSDNQPPLSIEATQSLLKSYGLLGTHTIWEE